MFLTAECTYICPESPLSFLPAATEADSLLGMEPSVIVWSLVTGQWWWLCLCLHSSIFSWLLNCNYHDCNTRTHMSQLWRGRSNNGLNYYFCY